MTFKPGHNGQARATPADKTRAVIAACLMGKSTKEIARISDLPYNTVAELCRRYVEWVPRLKKPLPGAVKINAVQPELPLTPRTYGHKTRYVKR